MNITDFRSKIDSFFDKLESEEKTKTTIYSYQNDFKRFFKFIETFGKTSPEMPLKTDY